MDPTKKAVYLTFDDGPIPEVTPWVLDVLDHYGIRATFFMVGDNIRKHPREFEMVKARGHRLGNHTFNHIGGFRHGISSYVRNVDKANYYLHTDLFRPPHGWMKWEQYAAVRKRYRVVMWDLVTRDYSTRLNGRDVLCPPGKHHHLPRLAEKPRQTALRLAARHRMAQRPRLRVPRLRLKAHPPTQTPNLLFPTHL